MEVNDEPAERGITLSNIINALILMVMSWVGYSIEQIKDNLATMSIVVNVNSTRIDKIEDRVEQLPPAWLQKQIEENRERIDRYHK